MSNKGYTDCKNKLQKLFNENKELKRTVTILENELARAKRPCKCEKPPKEAKEHPKPSSAPKEAVLESNSESCPKCSGTTIKAEYSKQGEPWLLVRCINPSCKYRKNGKA